MQELRQILRYLLILENLNYLPGIDEIIGASYNLPG
jgi:hypothetical protein